MNHSTKAYVSCLVLDAALLSYFYIAVLPFHPEQTTQYGEFFILLNAVIIGVTFGLPPIRMVDPMKQQLGEQQITQVEHIAPPKYNPSLCEACGTPTGKARFCPNCGLSVRGASPQQRVEDNPLSLKLVPVMIEGTAMIPQGQIQDIKVTKVKMGKPTAQNRSTEEPKVVRNKRVKPMPEPPLQPVDPSPLEPDLYEK